MFASAAGNEPTEPCLTFSPEEFDPSVSPLNHVRSIADSITERIRHVLAPEGFRPLRVLVVDDHADAADSLAALLELLGCNVRACQSGLSALALAESFIPQVCLLDLMMPGMDGLELAFRLKTWAGRRPLLLVAITALGDSEMQARTALAGFHYHLTKPVDVAKLIDALTRLGEIVGRYNTSEGHRPNENR